MSVNRTKDANRTETSPAAGASASDPSSESQSPYIPPGGLSQSPPPRIISGSPAPSPLLGGPVYNPQPPPGAPLAISVEDSIHRQRRGNPLLFGAVRRNPILQHQYQDTLRQRAGVVTPRDTAADTLRLPSSHPLRQRVGLICRYILDGEFHPATYRTVISADDWVEYNYVDVLRAWERKENALDPNHRFHLSTRFRSSADIIRYAATLSPSPSAAARAVAQRDLSQALSSGSEEEISAAAAEHRSQGERFLTEGRAAAAAPAASPSLGGSYFNDENQHGQDADDFGDAASVRSFDAARYARDAVAQAGGEPFVCDRHVGIISESPDEEFAFAPFVPPASQHSRRLSAKRLCFLPSTFRHLPFRSSPLSQLERCRNRRRLLPSPAAPAPVLLSIGSDTSSLPEVTSSPEVQAFQPGVVHVAAPPPGWALLPPIVASVPAPRQAIADKDGDLILPPSDGQ